MACQLLSGTGSAVTCHATLGAPPRSASRSKPRGGEIVNHGPRFAQPGSRAEVSTGTLGASDFAATQPILKI